MSLPSDDLWWGTSGPPDAPIVIVGESWGAEEAAEQRPFVGSSGTELNRMLASAGFERDKILCLNVVSERPQSNEMWRFFHAKSNPSGKPAVGGLDPRDNVRESLGRLYRQIISHPRKCVVAAGNYALWALAPDCCGKKVIRESNGRRIPNELQPLAPDGIGSWRGSMWYTSTLEQKIPLLPIYHPAGIMRQWSWREPTVHDLKTRLRLAIAGDWRPNPEPVYWAPPTYVQAISRLRLWLSLADAGTTIDLAEDIETARGLITCLGLADSTNFAMSIPFVRKSDDNSFDSWYAPDQEAEIVRLLRRINSHPRIRIIGQNFLYDTQYIQHYTGRTPQLSFDTMLAQNTIFPGTPKALEYLSSLYCHYHWYWKEDHKEWDMKGRIEDLLRYNCTDCVRTWEIAQAQRGLIKARGLEEPWRIKMKTNDLCLRMMNRGVRIAVEQRGRLTVELTEHLNKIDGELLRIIPQEWVDPDYKENLAKKQRSQAKNAKYVYWYTSSQQTKTVFHEILGLPQVMNRKTGKPTSGKEARSELKKKFPEWKGLFDRLGMAESVENTLAVLRAPLDPDNRIRCSFGPGGTETHRLNSSKNAFGRGTNLQNLTEGDEDD